MPEILVIDDEEGIRYTFDRFLRATGHTVTTVEGCAEALAYLAEAQVDLVVADIILQDGMGIDILREIRSRGMACPVIMITGAPNVDSAVESVRLGAFDYLRKPVTEQALLHAVGMALKYKAVTDEKEKYRTNLEAIFKSVKDPIVTVDRNGAIIEMNEAATRSCTFSRQSIGMPFKTVMEGCQGKCLEVLEEAIRSRSPVELDRIECQSLAAPGRVLNLSAFPLLGSRDEFSGVVMMFKDETHLVCLEKELEEHKHYHRLVGRSSGMQRVFSLIEALGTTQTTVLITGESGTGKELVAEALHAEGGLDGKPLVKVNCSALPDSLLESELFGHVKGAFTGAVQDRIGRFHKAHGGTIFLDEIGDLSPKIQAELLRVIQEREFERVGDSTSIKVDVRVIAATNKDLRAKVKLGEFREDLFYRLKVVEITLPPLRERLDDIPLLVEHFRKKFNKTFGKTIEAVSRDVMEIFLAYGWPGNVRELEHTMEHAFVLCRNATITVGDLPRDLPSAPAGLDRSAEVSKRDDAQAILEALEKAGGNKAKAARLLGIDRATLYRKMQRYHLGGESEQEQNKF
jgi:two-component system, NtrC family, response regulator HydG